LKYTSSPWKELAEIKLKSVNTFNDNQTGIIKVVPYPTLELRT